LTPGTLDLIAAQKQRQDEGRARIAADHSSIENYRQSLVYQHFDQPESPLLEPFYALYQKIFSLEEEQEPIEGFQTVLRLNWDSEAQRCCGPVYEVVTIVTDPQSGKLIGAANYTIFSYPEADSSPESFDGSCQLNFLCIDFDYRGIGLGSHLLDMLETNVRERVTATTGRAMPRLFFTCEQNNPTRMTPDQIDADAVAALIEPYERLRWWAKRGYARLGFAYEQPPLSPDHEPCSYIDYYIRIPADPIETRTSFPSMPLLEHLRRFFFFSVGKFSTDMETNPQWLEQRDELSRNRVIPVFPPVT
jgi:GNAT superfamily N-acetyltransferase